MREACRPVPVVPSPQPLAARRHYVPRKRQPEGAQRGCGPTGAVPIGVLAVAIYDRLTALHNRREITPLPTLLFFTSKGGQTAHDENSTKSIHYAQCGGVGNGPGSR